MSVPSSSEAAWFTRLEPVAPPDDLPRRPDDPRLGEVVEFWAGGLPELRPGQPVLIGFPQDEGVRRNGGRVGAAEAPREIRRWLYRLLTWDWTSHADLADLNLLDLGNVRIEGGLEDTQASLGEVVGAVLRSRAVPIVLGGGHETAYGHFLGYVSAGLAVGVVNLDAHLDVRPLIDGRGHSGSPFRQMMEHLTHPLPGRRFICIGAQPHTVARLHYQYVVDRGGTIFSSNEVAALGCLYTCCELMGQRGSDTETCVYVSLDADLVRASDVPGVSAPNAAGVPGNQLLDYARLAGELLEVTSFDLVEINPRYDRDGQSARWAALAIWHFLVGLASRQKAA